MTLFDPFDAGPLGRLKNRIAMAPMTRGFASDHHANAAMAAYYAKRADAGVGLIFTEGVVIHQSGDGYRNVPHIETDSQAAAWKPVLDAVHAAGTRMICQLWHCGRISHPDFTGGVAPVSSTNRAAEGRNRQNDKPYGVPHALEPDEMPGIYAQYADAAERALAAGFDAVELHGANGYLIDEFLDANVNDRTDSYGGSVEGRSRFLLECLEAVFDRVGAENVCVRISPARDMGGPYEWPDLDAMLAHLVPAMAGLGLRMLSVTNARADHAATGGRMLRKIRPLWPHFLVGGASLSIADAAREVDEGWIDAVTWGRALIANPDLAARLRDGTPLTEFEPTMLRTLE